MRGRFDTPEAECLADDVAARGSSKRSSVRPRDAYRGRVLVVDDDDGARALVAAVLSGEGFDVLQARDGEEGMAFYSVLHRAIDAVVVDVQMPGMDGVDTFRAIRGKNPDAKVVLCSGAPTNVRVRQALLDGAVAFIAKPFAPTELVETVVRAVAEGGERATGA